MEEWNGALADAPFFGASWLDLANRRCENRIPYAVSLVNPQFAIFREKGVCRRGFSFFLHSAQRIPLALEENPLVFYCFLKWFLLL